MIENEAEIICSKKHKQPIQLILMDHRIPPALRLLCSSCISELQGKFFSISFESAKSIILEKQKSVQQTLSEEIQQQYLKLKEFKEEINTLKSMILEQFDSLLKISEDWEKYSSNFIKQKRQYSFFREIDYLDESMKQFEERLIYEFYQFNCSNYKKLQAAFKMDEYFQYILSAQQAIDKLNDYKTAKALQIQQKQFSILKYDDIDTPHLAIQCPKHKSEIIYVDLTEGIKKEDRIQCVYCKKTDSISIVQFQELWDKQKNAIQQKRILIFNDQKFLLKKIIKRKIAGEIFHNNLYHKIDSIKETDVKAEISFVRMVKQLSQALIDEATEVQDEQINKLNKKFINNLQMVTQKIEITYESFQQELSDYKKSPLTSTTSMSTFNKISYLQIGDSVEQQEWCSAIAFNYNGLVMAATCNNDIKIWQFQNGKMLKTQAILSGHTNTVFCLVYSKKRNWIASAGCDCSLRLWKDMGNNQWQSSESGKTHKSSILCLLMNVEENQLISGSSDKSIKIWKIDFQTNQLHYEYSLDNHCQQVYSITLNESDTILASCSYDRNIVIWEKEDSQKWNFKDKINMSVNDNGGRICFINDQSIIWQQQSQGFAYILKRIKGRFIHIPELKIELKQIGSDQECLFPIIFNRKKQLLIQKHNKYIYIMRQQNDGKFIIECDPIDCESQNNYGGLTNDGQYLTIWNECAKKFIVFTLIYE